MKKDNITHKINENGDIIFELQDIMELLFDLGKQQFAIHLSCAFDETGILTDGVFNYTKFKEVDRSRIQRTRGVGNHAMRVYYDLEDILANYESAKIVTTNELEAKRRQEVIEKSNILFANPHSITAYHRYMDDMANTNADARIMVNSIQSYAQFVIGIAESIIETQDQYRKEGKV